MSTDIGGLLRDLAPQALGAVLRRHRSDFFAAEDAMQEALLAASVQWPSEGVPANPRGWLVTVAMRRLADWQRREIARRPKEAAAVDWVPADDRRGEPAHTEGDSDDSLTLLFLCCHPELTPSAQVALTLRAVGGLTTAEIARAFLIPETTMGQRISRAKKRIDGVGFALPTGEEFTARLAAVLEVLYLIFNEGYTASSGPNLHRAELTGEAIRLVRALHVSVPDGEVAGLLALMLLTDARRAARTDGAGALVPLAEQDRSRWDADLIAEGTALIGDSLTASPVGRYQVQAAIAALHDEAADAEDTDWVQIVGLYRVLTAIAPSPVVTLNLAVAVGMADGALAGLAVLAEVSADPRITGHHRIAAVRGHLLEMAGDPAGAIVAYEVAAAATASVPERHYLLTRAARLAR